MRTSPASSAPAANAARASATEPRLAATRTCVPSRETAGSLARARSRVRRSASSRCAPAGTPRPPPRRGSTWISPVAPSIDDAWFPRARPARRARPRRPAGCPAGPGEDRGVRRRAPGGEHDAAAPARCRVAAAWAGVRSRATRTPSASACVGRGAGERPAHLVTDRADVGRALAQVGVGQVGTTACSISVETARSMPRRPRRPCRVRRLTSASISVSASRVRWASKMPASPRPDLPRGEGTEVLDVAAYLGDGLDDAPPLGRRARRSRSRRPRPCATVSRRTGPMAMPGEAATGPAPAVETSGAGTGLDGVGLVERSGRQGEEVLDRLLGLRTGGADLDLVAAQRAEGGDPAEAAGRHRPGAGGQVASARRWRRDRGPRSRVARRGGRAARAGWPR